MVWAWVGSQDLRLTYGINEIAQALEVRRQTVAQWHHRGGILPPPHDRISAGPLWFSSLAQDLSYIEDEYRYGPPQPIDFFIAAELSTRLPTAGTFDWETWETTTQPILASMPDAELPPALIALIHHARQHDEFADFESWRDILTTRGIPSDAVSWAGERMTVEELSPPHWLRESWD